MSLWSDPRRLLVYHAGDNISVGAGAADACRWYRTVSQLPYRFVMLSLLCTRSIGQLYCIIEENLTRCIEYCWESYRAVTVTFLHIEYYITIVYLVLSLIFFLTIQLLLFFWQPYFDKCLSNIMYQIAIFIKFAKVKRHKLIPTELKKIY